MTDIVEEYKLWLTESSGLWNNKKQLTPRNPEGRIKVDPAEVAANAKDIRARGLKALEKRKKSEKLTAYRNEHGGVRTGVSSRTYDPTKTYPGGRANPATQRMRSEPQVRGPKKENLLTRLRKIFK